MHEEGHSSFGFEENIVAAASYIPILGFFIMLKEQSSYFVRFHALQSTIGYAALLVYWLLVKFIGALFFLSWSPGLLALIFCPLMVYKAHECEEFKLPIIGKYAYHSVYETREDILAQAEAEQSSKG